MIYITAVDVNHLKRDMDVRDINVLDKKLVDAIWDAIDNQDEVWITSTSLEITNLEDNNFHFFDQLRKKEHLSSRPQGLVYAYTHLLSLIPRAGTFMIAPYSAAPK